jgi:hypothetical protein
MEGPADTRGGMSGPQVARAPEPYTRPDLYDVLFSDLDFDRDYYLRVGRGAAGSRCSTCAGTGRILLPLLEAGVDVDGLDLYPAMLALARASQRGGVPPRGSSWVTCATSRCRAAMPPC